MPRHPGDPAGDGPPGTGPPKQMARSLHARPRRPGDDLWKKHSELARSLQAKVGTSFASPARSKILDSIQEIGLR
jgi:hypothetical protein